MIKAIVKFGLVGLLLATTGAVHAFHSYSVNHNYSILPGGNIVPQVTGKYYLHSYAIETGTSCTNGAVWPTAQPLGHDLFGGDRFTGLAGFMENNMTPVVLEVVPLPSSGVPSYSQTIAASCPGSSNGAATVEFSVNPYSAGSAVTGVTQCSGFVDPQGANSGVYSVSAAEVVFQGGNQLLNGTIQWLPQIVDSITGGAVQGLGIPMPILDPIEYYVHDANSGDLLASGTLFSINVDQGPQPTSGGVILVDSWGAQMRCYENTASIEIDQTSSLITQQGYLRVEMTNGVVSAVTKTGTYASSAVSLNDPAPVSFALPAIQFDYDLGTFPGHDVEVTLVASGGGQSELGQITSACGGGFMCPPSPVPPYLVTFPSPVTLPHWSAQGVAADDLGIVYLNDHSTVPAIYKGAPGGPFTTLATQTTGGITNPPGAGGGVIAIDLGDMTWDASRSALWAGGLWEQSPNVWVGHGDVYQVDPNTGACRYRFTIPGLTDPVFGISWDRTDNSLWCAEYTGSAVYHVTSLATPAPGAAMQIWDSGSNQVLGITGICATNFGLWVTGRSSNNEITLHNKVGGTYAGQTITTSCCELEGLECDPVNFPGCALWCADLVYGNYTAYLIPDGSCTTGWRLGDHCASINVIDVLPYSDAGTTVDFTDDFHASGNTSPDVIYSFVPQNSGVCEISVCGSGFAPLLEVRTGEPCPGSSQILVSDFGLCSDDTIETPTRPTVKLHVASGTTYFIILDGRDFTFGNYTLEVSQYASSSGDNCSSAIAIESLPYTAVWTTAGAEDDYHCGGNSSSDVVYAFTPVQSGEYAVLLSGAMNRALIEVLVGGSCPGNSQIACVELGSTLNGDSLSQNHLEIDLSSGTTYYLIVDGQDSQSGAAYMLQVVPLAAEERIVCPLGESFFESSSFPAEWSNAIGTNPPSSWNNVYDPNRHGIVSYPSFDPVLGGSILPRTREGTYAIKLGNEINGSQAEQLSTHFLVTSANTTLRFSYAVVLEDPGHTASDQPFFQYSVYAFTPFPVTIASVQKYADASDPYFLTVSTTNGPIIYHPWECVSIDLNDFVGQQVFLDFRTADCAQGGHFGYAYIDGFCDAGYQPVLTMADTVCDNDPTFIADGSASTGESSHFWSVELSDEYGNRYPETELSQWFVAEQAGERDLKAFYLGLGGQFTCGNWYRAKLALNDGGCFGWRSVEKLFYVACCGPGCCCYCDSLGQTFQGITTQAECSLLAGLWTASSTCENPCSFPEHVEASLVQMPDFDCVNGILSPTTFNIEISINNLAPFGCDVTSIQIGGGTGAGGTAILPSPTSGSFQLALGGSQVVSFPILIASSNPDGGCIDINVSINSSCCVGDTVFCIDIPECPCPYEDEESLHNTEVWNNDCETVEAPIQCGMYCGNIVSPSDVDFYLISIANPYPGFCIALGVDIYGNDTPSMFPSGRGLNPKVSVYSASPGGVFGTTCSSLIDEDDDSGIGNDSRVIPCIAPVNEYFIKVEGVGGTSGPYVIDVSCNACVCYTDTTVFDLGGGNMDFPNFAAAAAHFDTATIVGPQIVNVYPDTYNEPVTFGPVAGASAMSTITFKKIVGALLTNPVITWNGADVVTFDNADYYVWDGIDVAHLGVGAGSAIVMTNDADSNVVRNCALTNTQSGSTTYGVVMNSAANPSLTNDYNVFENLAISGFTDAVRLGNNAGIATSQTANEVRNCTISSCANGIVAGCQRDLRVHGNDISVSHPNHMTTYAVNIGQLNVDDTVRVHGNNIHDLSGSVAYGIYAATFQPNSMVWIYNNMISQWNGGVCQSIVVRQNSSAGVHFNSLYMNESPTATSYYGIGGGEAANISISNNILYSDAVSDPVYAIAMGSLVTFTTDHNCFYGTGAQYTVSNLFGNLYPTLASWQATGRDLNSVYGNPGYMSATDLHLDGYNTVCDAAGVPVSGMQKDIDLEIRDPLTPDIGADEFVLLLIDDLVINRIGTTNDIQLTWSPLPGAVSYKIYRHTDPSTLAPIPAHFIGSTTTGSYVDVGVLAPPDQKCFYIIQASTLP